MTGWMTSATVIAGCLAGCTGGGVSSPNPTQSAPASQPTRSSLSPPPSATPSPTVSETNEAPVTARIALGEGGALNLNGTRYGRGGPKEVAALIKALGEPDDTTSRTCFKYNMTERRWNDLVIYSLKQEFRDEGSPAVWKAGGISSWRYDDTLSSEAPPWASIKGPQGIGFGTTAAEVKAIYKKLEIFDVSTDGNNIDVFAGDTTGATYELDAKKRVEAMHAGGFEC